MKKKIILITLSFLALFAVGFVMAEEKIEIDFFYSQTCPHCAKEKVFLEELSNKYPQIELKEYMMSQNVELVIEKYNSYRVPVDIRGLVPISFIGDRYFLGFDEKTGDDIESHIQELIKGITPEPPEEDRKITLPFVGEIDISELPLSTLAILMGFFDGFDVCSLTAIILVLGIVLSFNSRTKVFFYGAVFILINALTYGLLMMFWLKVFEFIGSFLREMEILIGLIAIVGGIHFFRKFLEIRKTSPVCEVEEGWGKDFISKSSQKIKELFKGGQVFSIIMGLLIFDAVASVIEFPCSGALPVVFAGILSEAGLSTLGYLFYLSLFLLFYLLDELIVFLIAVFTMKIWTSSPKFVVWSNLALALTLLLLGAYYLLSLV